MRRYQPNQSDHRFRLGDYAEVGAGPMPGDRLVEIAREARQYGQDGYLVRPLSGQPGDGMLPWVQPGRMLQPFHPERWRCNGFGYTRVSPARHHHLAGGGHLDHVHLNGDLPHGTYDHPGDQPGLVIPGDVWECGGRRVTLDYCAFEGLVWPPGNGDPGAVHSGCRPDCPGRVVQA